MIHADEMATVWVVRGGDRDHLVKTFLDDGEIGVEMPEFGDGQTIDRTKALRTLGVGIDDEPTKAQEAMAAHFLSFVRRIKVGDVALLIDPAPGGLACGVVTGEYAYRTDLAVSRARHRRSVDWRRRLPFSSLPERLERLPHQRPVIEDVADGRLRDLALQCCRGELGDDPFDRPAVTPRTPRARSATPKRKAPARPQPVKRPERRCSHCLVTKPMDLFEDGSDMCVDCA